MEHAFFYRLSRILWRAIIGIIVALAIYVSFGRFLMSNVEAWGDEILRELNTRSPFIIEAEMVTGEWHSFTPEIVLSGLRLSVPGSDDMPLELAQGRVAIDVWESLQSRSLQIFRLSLDQLLLRGELTDDGKLLIAGMGGGGGGNFTALLEKFLLNTLQLNLTNNQLVLSLPDASQRLFDLNLALRREGSFRRVEANLVSGATATEIVILAKGVGNPMEPEKFSGEVYLSVVNGDLHAVQQLLPGDPLLAITGLVAAQAWLTWDRGDPILDADISATDLRLEETNDDWQILLDKLSLKASLRQRDGHWTLFGSELEVQKGADTLYLPRLQIDAWGDSLRLRASELPLAPLNALVLAQDATPEVLAGVFATLDAAGELTSLQLNVGDYHKPLDDWELTGNFEDLEVKSWNGAPGVRADSGYVQLETDGGFVIVDSHQFSMTFPTVYREPLRFDDFYGTVFLDWTATDITVTSGPMTTRGIEGTATAVFALNVPLVESNVGLEMDLLVGLENTHPMHRTKYVPYILDEGLSNWLSGSVGQGHIEEGAFLWRGSLRKGASALRTVQLFFNVTDTNLDYYPGWPPLSALEATVLVDDSRVSVWSDEASLYGSSIDFLSAEAWMNEDQQMMLAIASEMKGDAADGLQVINHSPLTGIVGAAFSQWELNGELETHLELELNLNDSAVPPQVDVLTQWTDVDLRINPGNLNIEHVTGQLAYSSATGFSSSGMTGKLWGEALTAQVRQAGPSVQGDKPGGSVQYDAATSTTEIELATRVDMDDVRQWLGLELLALAQGETTVELLVEVPPGLPPTVSIESDLEGVSLDLPDPWAKTAQVKQPLAIDVTLDETNTVVGVDLDSELSLSILQSNDTFSGLSLGIKSAPAQVRPGVIRVTGHAALVDQQQWQDFLDEYIYPGFGEVGVTDVELNPGDSDILAAAVEPASTDEALEVFVENIQADTLVLYGQELADAVFSIEKKSGTTRVTGDAQWFSTELLLYDDDSPAKLMINHLDLEGLSDLTFTSEGEGGGADSFDIPDMDVIIEQMNYEDQSPGALAFSIRREDNLLRAEDIVGNFAGLSLTPQRPGSLVWSRQESADKTQMRAALEFQDLGQTLEQLGYQNIVETESGQIDVALEWPGGPHGFSLAGARGSVGLDIAEGRFLDTPAGASGTLRVVGILNLADIVQRLSLNLSDMFASGIPFHSIEGEIFFHGGQIEVSHVDVKGRSSSFQFTGISDVARESLDGELIATLPVANNLPWVAALALGLPVAAGVFVVSKVFEKQVNRFSSAVYSISGSWEDPQVNFDRIFDTSSDRKVIVPVLGDPNSPLLLPPDPNAVGVNMLDPSSISTQAQDPNSIDSAGDY